MSNELKIKKAVRPINFRGKRLDNGKWVYGGYHETLDESIIVAKNGNIADHNFHVDPETVGQFTGLLLKGVEIYDGDLIRVPRYTHKSLIARIGYGEYGTYLYYLTGYSGCEPWLNVKRINEAEVIGNIHDNPEYAEQGGEREMEID